VPAGERQKNFRVASQQKRHAQRAPDKRWSLHAWSHTGESVSMCLVLRPVSLTHQHDLAVLRVSLLKHIHPAPIVHQGFRSLAHVDLNSVIVATEVHSTTSAARHI